MDFLCSCNEVHRRKNENYWDFKADPFESLGAFFFPLFVFIFSAAKFVSRKAIYSGKFDDNEK